MRWPRTVPDGFVPAEVPLRGTMWSEEAKAKLRERLQEVHEWPCVYMYKFVLEPDEEKLQVLLGLFPKESEAIRRYSAGGKYVSITIKELMLNADDVVLRYQRASAIQGLIVL